MNTIQQRVVLLFLCSGDRLSENGGGLSESSEYVFASFFDWFLYAEIFRFRTILLSDIFNFTKTGYDQTFAP